MLEKVVIHPTKDGRFDISVKLSECENSLDFTVSNNREMSSLLEEFELMAETKLDSISTKR